MKKVLFHVGWPKTGTTSLQTGFRHWPNLAGQPWARGADGEFARAVCDQLCFSHRFAPEVLDAALTWSQRDAALPVVLSEERIVGTPTIEVMGHVGVAVVADRIAGTTWDPYVLFTLRPPRDLLRSLYLHEVRQGSGLTYAGFLDTAMSSLARGEGPLAFEGVLSSYEERFGTDRIAIAALEEFQQSVAGTWARIGERLQMPELRGLGSGALPHENRTDIGPPKLELFLNRHVLASVHHPRRGRLRPKISRTGWKQLSSVFHWDYVNEFVRHDTEREELAAQLIESELSVVLPPFGAAHPSLCGRCS